MRERPDRALDEYKQGVDATNRLSGIGFESSLPCTSALFEPDRHCPLHHQAKSAGVYHSEPEGKCDSSCGHKYAAVVSTERIS